MQNQNLNLIAAIVLSIGIIAGWQYFFEKPRHQAYIEEQSAYNQTIQTIKTSQNEDKKLDREEALAMSERVSFSNDYISGTINLKGLRLDDLIFLKYKESPEQNSNYVKFLNPNKTSDSYFAEFGWMSSSKDIILPDQDTLWICDKNNLLNGETIGCHWDNGNGLLFNNYISLDDKYMFNIKTEIINNSDKAISLQSYGLIYKTFDFESNRMSVVHEGIAGVFGEELKEYSYKDIKDKKKITTKQEPVNWFGITDKYWLLAFIPDKNQNYVTNSNFFIHSGQERYQADFVSPIQIIDSGKSLMLDHNIFGGAKELDILDNYEAKLNIKLFDRTVDFGWFYIITKPLLWLLHALYGMVGNFGLSIMIVTVLVKISMFSLANKSYKSMKIMKELQPQIEKIKERCGEDKVRMNQEVMNLYKVNRVNPLSGCLPIFIQIPVFFSLYKVLNVSIDMRQAPFYGWIKDLSVADPTNIFNLFGLLPFDPPSFLHIGVWPILMAGTMYMQQKLSPPATDPVQAQMMKMMPLIFLFMFGNFPSGLLIYWTWNNILSIIQQSYINYSHERTTKSS